VFEKWLKEKGVQHVKSSPYHPQGNVVVERLHRTLSAMITKTCESKSNWAKVVPMALYFIRCSPSDTTGLSPFMARQGWEPNTPLQLLYKSWAESDLGDVNLEEWVLSNAERVQNSIEKCVQGLVEKGIMRKEKWDTKAKEREFIVWEEVLLRKPGMIFKLDETWEGPFKITKKNSPLSYGVDTGSRKLQSVHVKLMKSYNKQEDTLTVGRAT